MPRQPWPRPGRAPRRGRGLVGAAALLCGVWLAGCGQKGPLVLPDPAATTPAPAAAASAAQRRVGTP